MKESDSISQAAMLISKSKYCIAFTGAGISVESGIPPFRGKKGLWTMVDPDFIEISNFLSNPVPCWKKIKAIFYDHWKSAKPNAAHHGLVELENMGVLQEIITQNIDTLHKIAGNTTVWEFHGTLDQFICINCDNIVPYSTTILEEIPPKCEKCHGLLKPDFVFFGEGIPQHVYIYSTLAIEKADIVLIIGTSGEVMPACMLPISAKKHGATLIEINPEPSSFTHTYSDIFLEGNAGEIIPRLVEKVKNFK